MAQDCEEDRLHEANGTGRRRSLFHLGGLRLPSLGRMLDRMGLPRLRTGKPGAVPGVSLEDLAAMPPARTPVHVSCIDYAPGMVVNRDILDFDSFIKEHRPEGTVVRWINVNGIHDSRIVRELMTKYGLHPLAVEDMLQLPQRAKVDPYVADGEHQARLFIVARMVMARADEHIYAEQISVFLGHNTVLTFQITEGDVWDPIRQRLMQAGTKLRRHDASFLVYALLDAMVDHCFSILEQYSRRLEELEAQVMSGADPRIVQRIYEVERELLLLARQIWPMREVIQTLQHMEHECMSSVTRTYLRDVYDHAVQILEMLETYRELAESLAQTHLNIVNTRLNQVMKILTIYSAIFIPLTFLTGVYGMNFVHLPGLEWEWSFTIFCVVCITVVGSLLAWFRRLRWL